MDTTIVTTGDLELMCMLAEFNHHPISIDMIISFMSYIVVHGVIQVKVQNDMSVPFSNVCSILRVTSCYNFLR